MREIKYRGIDVVSGDWVYGSLVTYPNSAPAIITVENSQIGLCQVEYVVDEETVGEFTGLLDKNGKEIYEGDILAYIGLDRRKINLIVKWSEGDASFLFGGVRTDYAIAGEVICNIYENPELINS